MHHLNALQWYNQGLTSPFPGMDPYLESRWSDVHASLITLIRTALQPKLPKGLRARAEERILLEDLSGARLAENRGDVSVVVSPRAGERRTELGAATIAVPEPFVILPFTGPQVDRFVQIIDAGQGGNRVVTTVEVLSPWNKAPGRLNKDYREKLRDFERAGVNVVEIDLLRSPRGGLAVTDQDLPASRRTPYLICVQRAAEYSPREAYSVSLNGPIPPVRIPLRETDLDVVLELQPLIGRAYEEGGHDDIDYSRPPDPPLDPADAAWADDLLRSAGRR